MACSVKGAQCTFESNKPVVPAGHVSGHDAHNDEAIEETISGGNINNARPHAGYPALWNAPALEGIPLIDQTSNHNAVSPAADHRPTSLHHSRHIASNPQSQPQPRASIGSLLQDARVEEAAYFSPMQSHQAESLDTSQRDMQGNLNRPDLDQHNTYMEDNYTHAHEADYHTSFPITEGQIASAPTEELGHYFDLSVFDSSTFRASKMDWLGCDTNFSDAQTSQSLDLHMHTPSTYGDLQQMHAETVPQDDFSHDVASCGPAQHAPLNIDRPTNQQPVASDNDNQATWPHVLDRGGNEMWPFDYASNRGFRRIKLPPLRQVLEDTVGHRPAIEKSTLKDLIKVLSAPQIPSFNDSPALEALPAVSFLTKLVKIYFAEFHPVLSVIHVPTWGIENCPTALLAAMASFGATYSTAEGSQEVAALLAEITQRALFWMVRLTFSPHLVPWPH